MFRYIEPSVAGWLGAKTVGDFSVHPPIISHLDYEFDQWVGDDILETFPCYIVTERLKREIEKLSFTGVVFATMEVSFGKKFAKSSSIKDLPTFYWLQAVGIPRKDDFGIAADYRLLISDDVHTMLGDFKCLYARFQLDPSSFRKGL